MLHFGVKHGFGRGNREIQYSLKVLNRLNANFNTRETRFFSVSTVKFSNHEI